MYRKSTFYTILDAKCQLSNGKAVNIEVQKANDDNHQKRVRYNGAILTTNIIDTGLKFENVPDVCIVFISKFDVFNSGYSLYNIDRIVRQTGEVVNNGFEEIYVSACVKDGSDVSELMYKASRCHIPLIIKLLCNITYTNFTLVMASHARFSFTHITLSIFILIPSTKKLHELPIMVPIAFVLEFFVVSKLATALAFTVVKPDDRPQIITYAISICICCIMCPIMSLVATLLFKENKSFGTWIQTWAMNFPMALLYQLFYCGPLVRLIFRTIFRVKKTNKQKQNQKNTIR